MFPAENVKIQVKQQPQQQPQQLSEKERIQKLRKKIEEGAGGITEDEMMEVALYDSKKSDETERSLRGESPPRQSPQEKEKEKEKEGGGGKDKPQMAAAPARSKRSEDVVVLDGDDDESGEDQAKYHKPSKKARTGPYPTPGPAQGERKSQTAAKEETSTSPDPELERERALSSRKSLARDSSPLEKELRGKDSRGKEEADPPGNRSKARRKTSPKKIPDTAGSGSDTESAGSTRVSKEGDTDEDWRDIPGSGDGTADQTQPQEDLVTRTTEKGKDRVSEKEKHRDGERKTERDQGTIESFLTRKTPTKSPSDSAVVLISPPSFRLVRTKSGRYLPPFPVTSAEDAKFFDAKVPPPPPPTHLCSSSGFLPISFSFPERTLTSSWNFWLLHPSD